MYGTHTHRAVVTKWNMARLFCIVLIFTGRHTGDAGSDDRIAGGLSTVILNTHETFGRLGCVGYIA